MTNVQASGTSGIVEGASTPAKVDSATPKKAKNDFYQQQSDYFNQIDNYKVPGISTKKRKSSLRKR